MAQSIGDLFIKLGFQVDSQPLKDFSDSINSTFKGLLQFAGVDLGVQGLKNIAASAANSALSMRDLNAQFGISYGFMQKFQGQWAHLNPLDDPNAALRIETNLAQYQANMRAGIGGSEAGHFGVVASDSMETMLAKIQQRLPLMLQQNPSMRGYIEQWVTAIFGDPRAMTYLQTKQEELDIAGELYNQTKKQREETVEAAEALGNLHLAWDNFFNHIVASMAEGILQLNNFIKNPKAEDAAHPILSGIGRWVDWLGGKDIYGLADTGKAIINGSVNNPIMNSIVSGIVGGITGGANGNKLDATSFWQSKGYNNAQIAGWLAQEQAESTYGTNPNMNKNGHYGAFQWSASRAANIFARTGIDVKTAPHWKQLQAADWEFNNMNLSDQFRGINHSAEASEFLSKKFESHEKYNNQHGDEAAYRAKLAEQNSGDITNNTTINLQSNSDDNHELAQRIAEYFHHRIIEPAHPQFNKGGY